jgi:hypothetical protein
MNEIGSISNNVFLFTFVRMNPPTPGHLLVIDSMMNEALRLNVNKIFILLSSTMDEKNPMPCGKENDDPSLMDSAFKSTILKEMVNAYKQKMINESFNEEEKMKIASMELIVLCAKGNTFGFIGKIIQQYYIDNGIQKVKCIFFVGEDRADFATQIVNYFETKDFIENPVDTKILSREGMEDLIKEGPGETAISEIPLSQFSASFVRKLVKDGKTQEFYEVYKDYLDAFQIENLFITILDGLNNPKKSSKTRTKKGGKRIKKTKKGKKKTKQRGKSKKTNK